MSDPEAQRLLAEANLAGFELIRYMIESGGDSSSEGVAERVLRYQAAALAAHAGPGQYQVAVSPEQVLLYAQLAGAAAMTFTAMVQVRKGRKVDKGELLKELAEYQTMLLLGELL